MALAKDVAQDVAVIKERLAWHFRVGGGVIAAACALLVWLLNSYLPNQLANLKTEIQVQINQVTNLQLDKVATQVAFLQQSGTRVDPTIVAQLGRNLIEIAAVPDRPKTTKAAWNVTNQLLGYRSSLPTISEADLKRMFSTIVSKNKDEECIEIPKGARWGFAGFIYEHCTQHLDPILGPGASESIILRGIVFRDVRVIYSGRPVNLAGVYFVNCTFELQPGKSSEKLAETLLAETPAKTVVLP